jgi:hypothetical protein
MRLEYISLIGLGAIVPLAVGMRPIGAIFALISVLCVMWYIECDRKREREREQARPGFPVIVNGPDAE